MKSLSLLEAALAAIGLAIYFFAFYLYNEKMLKGEIKPNKATWAMWAVLASLNAISYNAMSGDWVKSIGAYGGCITNIGTFLLALHTGKLTKLGKLDKFLMGIGLSAIAVWWLTHSATYGNLILQLCIFISITPTYTSTWDDPSSERPLHWFMFGGSYVFPLAIVLLRWQGHWEDLVFPINAGSIQLVVGFLALRRPRRS